MTIRQLLFIHGAGGYDDDKPVANRLRTELAAELRYPHLPEDDMSVEAWAGPIRAALHELNADGIVVGHSFGASILLSVLVAEPPNTSSATLLAMPNWEPHGWDVEDYAFTGPEPKTRLTLHHCHDDEVVPFEHLALNARRLPSAAVVDHRFGGHQFDGVTIDLG